MDFTMRTAKDCTEVQDLSPKPRTIEISCQPGFQPTMFQMQSIFHDSLQTISLNLRRDHANKVCEVDELWISCIRHSRDLNSLTALHIRLGWFPRRGPGLSFSACLCHNLTYLEFNRVNFDGPSCCLLGRTLVHLRTLSTLNFYSCRFGGPAGDLVVACLQVPKLFLGVSKSLFNEDLVRLKPGSASNPPIHSGGTIWRYLYFRDVEHGPSPISRYLNAVVEKTPGMMSCRSVLTRGHGTWADIDKALDYMINKFIG